MNYFNAAPLLNQFNQARASDHKMTILKFAALCKVRNARMGQFLDQDKKIIPSMKEAEKICQSLACSLNDILGVNNGN